MLFMIHNGDTIIDKNNTYYIIDTDDLIVSSVKGSKLIHCIENLEIEVDNIISEDGVYRIYEDLMYMSDYTYEEDLVLFNGEVILKESDIIIINSKEIKFTISKKIEVINDMEYTSFYASIDGVIVADSYKVNEDEIDDLYFDDFYSFFIDYVFRLGDRIFVRYCVFVNTDNADPFVAVFDLNGNLLDMFSRCPITGFDIYENICKDKAIKAKYESLINWKF